MQKPLPAFDAPELDAALDDAELKAWDSLGRYKFVMFGYWVGVWVHLNRLKPRPRPNPFRELVQVARRRKRGEKEVS